MKDLELENNILSLHSRGWSIRRLAVEFKVSRGRIRRIIDNNNHQRIYGEPVKKKKPGKQSSKLDDFKELINETLEKYQNPSPTNQRLFEIIKQQGYDGGITILSNYLKQIRGKKSPDPIICVETAP